MTPDAVRALIAEAEPHLVDPSSGWVCCEWCGELRDQECESCEKPWPCVTRRLADALAARTVETAEELWGVVLDDFGSTDYYDTRAEADEVRKRAPDTGLVRVVTTTIVSPTPEEADPEEVSRLSAKIIAREKPLLDRLAAHDGPEEPDTARECGNDSHHGYGTGYCGDCEEEGGHGD